MQNLRTNIYKKPHSHFGAFSIKCTNGKKMPLKSDAGTYIFSFNGKEKIDEINGTGNDLDFGARVYDTRLGRWMSLDLLASKYPDLTPYNFCVNSPLLLKDIDGKDFIATVTNNKDGTTTLNISATVYVVGASIAQVAEMNRISKEVLVNGKSGNTTIVFDVQFKALPAGLTEKELINLIGTPSTHIDQSTGHARGASGKNGANVLFTDGRADLSSRVISLNRKPTNIGVLNSSKMNDTEIFAKEAFHESLHFLGLSDRYTEIKQKVLNPKTGKFEDKRSTIPNPNWANDVLANLCVTGFNQTHYDNIANFFSGKTGTEEVKTKKTGFIDRDKNGKLKGKAK